VAARDGSPLPIIAASELKFKFPGQGLDSSLNDGRRYTYALVDLWNKPVILKCISNQYAHEEELAKLARLDHPHLAHIYGITDVRPDKLTLVIEYAEAGTLLDAIRNFETQMYDQRQALDWMLQIASALEYIHSVEMCYRALHAKKILYKAGRKTIMLASFGLTRDLSTNYHDPSTVYSVAPELFKGRRYTTATDIYALGVLTWAVAMHAIPYEHEYQHKELKNYHGDRVLWYCNSIVEKGARPFPLTADAALNHLIMQAWHPVPAERPNITTYRQELRRGYESLSSLAF
jgi:serine/threonine protein kinase